VNLWIRFVIGCFGSKERLWPTNTLKGVVGTWIVFVLADIPYAYLNAQNIHSALFSIRFRASTWVRWIVRVSGCLRLFSFITILYIIVGFYFCGLLGQVLALNIVLPYLFNLIFTD